MRRILRFLGAGFAFLKRNFVDFKAFLVEKRTESDFGFSFKCKTSNFRLLLHARALSD